MNAGCLVLLPHIESLRTMYQLLGSNQAILGTSLVVQWQRIILPMQGMRV